MFHFAELLGGANSCRRNFLWTQTCSSSLEFVSSMASSSCTAVEEQTLEGALHVLASSPCPIATLLFINKNCKQIVSFKWQLPDYKSLTKSSISSVDIRGAFWRLQLIPDLCCEYLWSHFAKNKNMCAHTVPDWTEKSPDQSTPRK